MYYLLGEEFDRDPFLIFRLRGIEREELVNLMGSSAASAPKTSGKRTVPQPEAEPEESAEADALAEPAASAPADPLSADPSVYWGEGSLAEDFFGEVRVPSVAAALPKRLGSVPFWRAEANFLDAMEAVYRAASTLGMDVFLGERTPSEEK